MGLALLIDVGVARSGLGPRVSVMVRDGFLDLPGSSKRCSIIAEKCCGTGQERRTKPHGALQSHDLLLTRNATVPY
jgi:hypothetical protein